MQTVFQQEQKISELQARLEQVMSDRQAYVKESVEVSSRLQSGPIVAAPSFRPQSVSQSLSNSAVDQLRQHESKIAELTAELAVANARASEWESERSTLLSRIETRDGEVKRLAEVLESERNWDKMQAEAALKAQHKQIHKLEVQLDYLNSARKDWERDAQSFKEHGVSAHFVSQLQESRAQTQQARHEAEQSAQRVEQLHAQLEQARASISTLEASKIGVDERVHRAVQEQEQHAREEIAQLQASFAQLQSKLSESEQAHLDAQSKITSLEHELHLVRHAASSKTSELNSKQTLLAHNSELVATLNAQILELRQAVRSVESQKAKVESEWRLAMQELEQTKVALHQAMDSTTATGIGLQSKVQEMLAIRVQNDQLASEKHALEVELSARDQRIQSLVAEAQANQTERQQLLQSLGQADETLSTVQGEVSNLHSELQQKEQAYANLSADFEQRSAQLDELRSSKFPSLQGQMAQLKAEKDKLAAQLHDLQSHTLATATQELQSSKAEVVRLQSNQTELLSRLEDAQAKTAEAEARHTALERELHALRHASGTKSTQLSSHAALIEHHADTIARLNLTITDLKSLCRSTESQRATLESEWKASLAEVERLKRELGLQMDLHGNHSLVLASKGQEVVELKAQISSMAEEAQRQHFELQQRDRRIEQMQSQVQSVQEGSKQLSHLVDERGEQSSALQDALRAKEYELNDLSSQLSTLQRAHQKAQQDLALKDADLKAMLSDLENILRENQVLTAELSQSRQAKEVTTLDAERQATRASHAEELFRAKESECLDLLSNYRAVCLENERVKLAGNELENERANHRQQLKQQQDALFKQEVALKAAEGELRARMLDLHANEQAMQEMSRALEAQKRALDSAHAEKRDLSSQLEAARMVATGLEQGRTEQGRLLAENRSALAKAQIDAQSAAMDGAHLTHSLAQAKAHHANLEHIIASLRAQAYDASQLHAQALAEKSARVSTLTQELQQARIHADTMQEQINTLNQYREKQNQEINRLLQSAAASSVAGGKSSSSSSVAASPEVLSQLTSLQGVVDAQFARLQELQKEKAKLKGYMVKYEAELRSWEKKGAAAQAHAQQQQQQQQQQQPQAIGSPGAHAAAAANVNASHRIDHSSVLSPGQPAQQQQQQQAHAAAGQQQQQLQHSVVNQSSASFLVQHP
jgi:chromosome segregation ATPase